MSKKKSLCLDKDQEKRLVQDTYKLGAGIDEGICPTVREMVEEHVPKSIRKKKQKQKQEIESDSPALDFIGKMFSRKVSGKVRNIKNSILDWF